MSTLFAVLATLALFYQASNLLTGIVWSVIHGAGLAKFHYYLPLLGALSALWGGWHFIRRKHRGALFYLVYALIVLGIFEAVWPGTPLKQRMERTALRGIVVQNIQDDLWLSKEGRPVGIRIRYEAVFPKTADYSISSTVLSAVSDEATLPYNLSIGHGPLPSNPMGSGLYLSQCDIERPACRQVGPRASRSG